MAVTQKGWEETEEWSYLDLTESNKTAVTNKEKVELLAYPFVKGSN